MNASVKTQNLEDLHPALWKASQLGRATTRCVDTGYLPLSNQLAGGGWPTGTCTELLVSQPGIGELRLIAPALAKVAHRKVALIQPPHAPNILALNGLGLAPSNLLWIKSEKTADVLWAAEQLLANGNFGAVLLWANHMRPEGLRRLNLAAQKSESLFFCLRPLAAAQDPSPSSLRLSLRPAQSGIEVGFIKRRGPSRDEPLFLPLAAPGTFTRRTHAPARDVPVEAHLTPERMETP